MDSLKTLLNDLFPAQASLSMKEYGELVVDLNMMKFYSIHAVELLLTRYAPLALDENWKRSQEGSSDAEMEAGTSGLHSSEKKSQRSHSDIVYEILSLDRGIEWAVYTEIRDRQKEEVLPDVLADSMQNVLKSFPTQEFSEISQNMLPKVLGMTPEQLEELEKKMKEDSDDPKQ